MIAAEGLKPEAVCIEDDLAEPAAFQLERMLIRAIGRSNLTNAVRGTQTEREREAAMANDMLSRLIPYETWAHIAERTDFEKELYWKVLDGLKGNAQPSGLLMTTQF